MPIAFKRLLNRIKQILIAKWFGEKLDGTGFHRAHRHRNVAMTGDEDDGNMNVCICEIALEIETAESGHSYVQYQPSRNIPARALKKLVGRRKCLNAEPYRS